MLHEQVPAPKYTSVAHYLWTFGKRQRCSAPCFQTTYSHEGAFLPRAQGQLCATVESSGVGAGGGEGSWHTDGHSALDVAEALRIIFWFSSCLRVFADSDQSISFLSILFVSPTTSSGATHLRPEWLSPPMMNLGSVWDFIK